MTQLSLDGLAAPFTLGQTVEWHPARARPGFTLGRPYTVAAVVDAGARWTVYAAQSKAKGGTVPRIVTSWPKANPDQCRIRPHRKDPTP